MRMPIQTSSHPIHYSDFVFIWAVSFCIILLQLEDKYTTIWFRRQIFTRHVQNANITHKLLLILFIDKQYYRELAQKEGRINRAKTHEEIIGRRHVTYTFSPKGTVEIAVKSSDTPFRLETDEDESVIFSFLGQVRDRLLYHLCDIRERHIPPVIEWVLKACDLNKDIEIQDN